MSGVYRDPRSQRSVVPSSSYCSILSPPGFQHRERSTPPPQHATISSAMVASRNNTPSRLSIPTRPNTPHLHYNNPTAAGARSGGGTPPNNNDSNRHNMLSVYNEEEEWMARRDAAELFNQMGSLTEENARLKQELELATDIIRALRTDNAELTTKVATLESSGMASSVTASIRSRVAASAAAHSSIPQHHLSTIVPSSSKGYNVALSTPASLSSAQPQYRQTFPDSQSSPQHSRHSTTAPQDYIIPPAQQQHPTTTRHQPSLSSFGGGFLGSGGGGGMGDIRGFRAGPNVDALQTSYAPTSSLDRGNPQQYQVEGGRSTSSTSGGGASMNASSPVRVRPIEPSSVPTSALTNSLLLANRRRLHQRGDDEGGDPVYDAVVSNVPSGAGGYFGRGVGGGTTSSASASSAGGRAPRHTTITTRPDFGDSNTAPSGGGGNVSRSFSATSLLNMLHGSAPPPSSST